MQLSGTVVPVSLQNYKNAKYFTFDVFSCFYGIFCKILEFRLILHDTILDNNLLWNYTVLGKEDTNFLTYRTYSRFVPRST